MTMMEQGHAVPAALIRDDVAFMRKLGSEGFYLSMHAEEQTPKFADATRYVGIGPIPCLPAGMIGPKPGSDLAVFSAR